MTDEYNDYNIAKWNSPVQGICPKHGKVSDVISISMPKHPELDGKYCQVCWAEWIVKHIPKLLELDEEK